MHGEVIDAQFLSTVIEVNTAIQRILALNEFSRKRIVTY
jgi:hypothetical protein